MSRVFTKEEQHRGGQAAGRKAHEAFELERAIQRELRRIERDYHDELARLKKEEAARARK